MDLLGPGVVVTAMPQDCGGGGRWEQGLRPGGKQERPVGPKAEEGVEQGDRQPGPHSAFWSPHHTHSPAPWVPTATEQRCRGGEEDRSRQRRRAWRPEAVWTSGTGDTHSSASCRRGQRLDTSRTPHHVAFRAEMAEGSMWGGAAGCHQGLLWRVSRWLRRKAPGGPGSKDLCGYLFILNEYSSLYQIGMSHFSMLFSKREPPKSYRLYKNVTYKTWTCPAQLCPCPWSPSHGVLSLCI